MPVDYTTTNLVASLKRRGSIPTSQSLFLVDDFVALMDEEMRSILIPEILAVNEEYFVTYTDTAFVADQKNYRIPSRAMGGALRDIVIVDANGNETPVNRLSPETVKETNYTAGQVGIPGIYLQDDEVIVVPTPTEAGNYLRFKWERRPNKLVQATSAATISSYNTLTREVVVSSVPSAWATTTLFDMIRQVPSFTSVADDLAISAIAGTTLTFTAALPSGIAVGQYLCEAGMSPIPQLPYEAHFVIAQLGAAKCLEIMNDKGLKAAADRAADMIQRFLKIINPRIDGAQKKVTNRNGIFDSARGRAIFPR